MARKTRIGAAQRAVNDIHSAKKLLADARRRLSKATIAHDSPHVMVAPNLRSIYEAMKDRGPEFARYSGVVGYGLGQVRKAGMPTGELCVTIFVKRKLSDADLAKKQMRRLPKSVKLGNQRVRVDVVSLGTVRKHVVVGGSVGTASPFPVEAGTIGAYAIDNATGAPVAITAMHVSGLRHFPNGQSPVVFCTPSRTRTGPHELFGEILLGTQEGVDAAKIALADTSVVDNFIPGIGEIAGWRPLTIPGDNGAPVRMYGAKTSEVVSGMIIHPTVALPSLNLDEAILVDIPSQKGDSGASLVDNSNHLLGFLVGQVTGFDPNFPRLRVFTPVAAVLNVLGCDI